MIGQILDRINQSNIVILRFKYFITAVLYGLFRPITIVVRLRYYIDVGWHVSRQNGNDPNVKVKVMSSFTPFSNYVSRYLSRLLLLPVDEDARNK